MNHKKIQNAIYATVVGIVIVFAGLSASSIVAFPGGYKMFVVWSGSMEPEIKEKSLVITKPVAEYKPRDIITFTTHDKPKSTVTHRIQKIQQGEDRPFFITQGDANNSTDSTPVSSDEILGKVIFSLPYLGYPVAFAKTQVGLIILVIIPGTIIIYSELMTIKNEAIRLIKVRRSRKLTKIEKAEVVVGKEVMEVEKEAKEVEKAFEKKVRKVIKKKKKKKK